MTWALKRQIFYIFILILFFGTTAFLLFYPSLNKPPTCFDGKQNGAETGVDCGGDCVRACTFETETASVLWARAFPVVPGRYNAVAYIENHNKTLVVDKIKYEFRFADGDNIFLGRREGVAYIPPGRNFAIFERGIDVGDFIPVYTTFSFTEVPNWVSVPEDKINQIQVFASDLVLDNESTSPHLQATLKNNSLFDISDVGVVVILYDEENNAISASSTYLDKLSKEEVTTINFTWPMPFLNRVVTTEVLPSFNILNARLK